MFGQPCWSSVFQVVVKGRSASGVTVGGVTVLRIAWIETGIQ
jgi:hypothetical protein